MATLTIATNPEDRVHRTFLGNKEAFEQWEVNITGYDEDTQTFTYTAVQKISVGPVSMTQEAADVLNLGMVSPGVNHTTFWLKVE